MDELGALLERQLARGVLEVVEQLDLGERELERPDRLEQVGIAVLVQLDDDGVELCRQRVDGGRGGRRVDRRGRLDGHARLSLVSSGMVITCTHASIACKL